MRFLLTAEQFGAQGAVRIGLVQEVVPTGPQLARATEIGEPITQQGSAAVSPGDVGQRPAREDRG